jgi:tetratricopeptide (TPR) repeat protein
LNIASRQPGTDALFLIHLGDLYVRTQALQPKNPSLKQRGLEALNRAAALKPANPNVRQKLGDTYAQLGDTEKSAQIYLNLLGEFREMPLMRDALREKLANIYLHGRDKSKAAEQLEAIVRDSPTRYPEAWYYLGTFSYDEKNYNKAAEYFERAILVNPEMEQAYVDLAGTQINLGQTAEALKTLEKARAKFPDSFTAEFFTGLAFARLKDYATALKHFTIAESIGNSMDARRLNYLFYFQVGTAYERNHDYVQAEKYFLKCLELQPEFSDALNYLGYMWAERGTNLEKARELIEHAVQLEPSNAAYLDSLGWVLYKLNEPDAALEPLLKAVALSEEPDAAVYDHLGDVYRAMNLKEKAVAAWQKSLSVESNDEVRKKLREISSL